MMSRLQLARDETDRMFSAGHAAANPSLVIAVMNAASSDYAAQLIARSPVCPWLNPQRDPQRFFQKMRFRDS
jgi:hypothetical protein